ncbi:MAG TPA: T9SS type A sorting domain-containing protein, partial [Ignavibacteria bacterium]|nr:T9SS type A sorting domain-containing protein [Ignavibacteria bacterium]HMR38786.1 T9SS type A sorting domain-containing protein [Ignavibacteria bacterium]
MFLSSHIKISLFNPRIFIPLLFLIINPEVLISRPDTEWISRYNGPGNSYDIVANMGSDAAGNIYVYGSSNNPSSLFDFALIKYNSSGTELWSANYDGEAGSTDQIFKGFTDPSGNSYVTGFTTNLSSSNVITTAKYDSSGNLKWIKFFNSAGYTNGFGQDITPDKNGNVIVCGFIRNVSGNYDIVTLKYSDNGDETGSVIYNGSGNGDDLPVSVKTDNLNNILVTATSKEISGGTDILVMKYDQELNFVWKKTFSGSVDSDNKASSSLMDDENSIYVSGSIYQTPGSYDYFYAKISAAGNVEWQGTYNGAGNYLDFSYAVTMDNSGNILLTGLSSQNTTSGSEDILTLKISPSGNLLWSRVFNGLANGTDQGIDVKTDNSGNVYVGGGSDKGNVHLIYALLKYDPDGNLIWEKYYENHTLSEDFISCVIVNENSDVYVTGISIGDTTNFDIVTIKYSQTTGMLNQINQIASEYYLGQNYPNPFNPLTNLGFGISEPGYVTLKIYNAMGEEVADLVNEKLAAGTYNLQWNASELPSGVYYYSISAEDYKETKKMILIK